MPHQFYFLDSNKISKKSDILGMYKLLTSPEFVIYTSIFFVSSFFFSIRPCSDLITSVRPSFTKVITPIYYVIYGDDTSRAKRF